jgi:hypothetical protein
MERDMGPERLCNRDVYQGGSRSCGELKSLGGRSGDPFLVDGLVDICSIRYVLAIYDRTCL